MQFYKKRGQQRSRNLKKKEKKQKKKLLTEITPSLTFPLKSSHCNWLSYSHTLKSLP